MISDFILSEDDIKIGQEVANGYYGIIYKGTCTKTGKEVAIHVRSSDRANPEDDARILREIEILVTLNHPFVVKLVGFTGIPTDSSSNDFKSVFEFVPNGSLNDVIKQVEKQKAPEWYDGTAKTKIAYGIAVAMAYVHSMHVIHRDLKPENVLLDEERNPVIDDFGFAKFIELDAINTSGIGTPVFMAPEILSEDNTYDYKVDVFSYSIILYNLLTSKINPYPGVKSQFALFRAISSGERPVFPEDFANTKIASLIRRCWDTMPEKRPSFEEIVKMFKTDDELVFPGCDQTIFSDYKNKI